MTIPKRLLLVGTPFMFFLLVGSLDAAPTKRAKCGQPPAGIAAFFQKIGFAAKTKACETILFDNINGEQCANPGRHCSGPDGPGKCISVYDPDAVGPILGKGVWSCDCVKP